MNIESVQRWFYDHVEIDGRPYELDDEQAAVVLDSHKNTIVTARAGSGKTYTLIAKIVYLTAVKGVDFSSILALGFNKDPQADFRSRLCRVLVDKKPLINKQTSEQMARTFHSFAMELSKKPNGEILFDDEKKRDKFARKNYIGKIVDSVIDGKKIYDFIRDDSYEPKREDYKTDEEYYLATKYQKYETLGGEVVRSRGEKIIADFLFEHNISYEYERVFYPKALSKYAINDAAANYLQENEKIIPDFYLKDYDIVWEHWGIRGDESASEIKRINESGAIGKYEEYDSKKDFKEWFYSKKWLDDKKIWSDVAKNDVSLQNVLHFNDFISTYYTPGISREDFEAEIRALLESCGIVCVKMPDAELVAKFKLYKGGVRQTCKRVESFIDRAEQQFPGDFEGLRQACMRETENQTRLFYKVALESYKIYLDEITAENYDHTRLIDKMYLPLVYNDDYALVMARAAHDIEKRTERTTSKIKIDDLKYIFLDEYQDFSLLFLNLITAIVKRVPDVRVLAVGDDWQAINGYAGASLEYFYNFEKYFPEDVARLNISTNRRSVFSVVELTNRFMANALGDKNGAKAAKDDKGSGSVVNNCVIDNIRTFYADEDHPRPRDYYRRYNLLLSEITKDNPGKTIKFLNRTRDFRFEKNDSESLAEYRKEFLETFKKYYSLDENRISFSTVNTAKGLEADVVVLLETDVGRFPIFHPDNHLYKVFGENEQKALDEQKRLFYVALTRAKEKIYIIHNNDSCEKNMTENAERKESDFLRLLEIEKFHKYFKDDFLPLQKKLECGKQKSFKAKKIEMKPNKFDSTTIDIIVTAVNNEKVVRYNAFSDDKSSRQMRQLMRWCSKTHPVTLKAVVDNRYSRPYIKLYDENLDTVV